MFLQLSYNIFCQRWQKYCYRSLSIPGIVTTGRDRKLHSFIDLLERPQIDPGKSQLSLAPCSETNLSSIETKPSYIEKKISKK